MMTHNGKQLLRKIRLIIAFFMLALIVSGVTAFPVETELISIIPLYWRFIDCSFGVFGIIPLLICMKWIKELEGMENESKTLVN